MRELLDALKELIEMRKSTPDDCKPAIDKAIDAITGAMADYARSGNRTTINYPSLPYTYNTPCPPEWWEQGQKFTLSSGTVNLCAKGVMQ